MVGVRMRGGVGVGSVPEALSLVVQGPCVAAGSGLVQLSQ